MGSPAALNSQGISYEQVWSEICSKITSKPASSSTTFAGDLAALNATRSELFGYQWGLTISKNATQDACAQFDTYKPRLEAMGFNTTIIKSALCEHRALTAAEMSALQTRKFSEELLGISKAREYLEFWCSNANKDRLDALGINGAQVQADACSQLKALGDAELGL